MAFAFKFVPLKKRICWRNEACKKPFKKAFLCRCPTWAFCRSLGRYYEAHCSANSNGYVWLQNDSDNI
ncbi:hypothetical protein B4U79_13069 [Dinothrombium tinctorium]|uniref:Uncharacterized protein n=1 Tax=Dinothrombium tinctorium TaxID=1965070 RepID=A0A3S3R1X3_9ACAR|nr:hypothetical protein B4U79_13069 [Dinothrombium tinctorium]